MSKRVIDTARSAAKPAAKANTKATYPSGLDAEWRSKQSVAHGDTGPASKTPPDHNKG